MVVERKNCHFLEVTQRHGCYQTLLGDAALATCYLINHTLSTVLDGQTPYSVLYPKYDLFFLLKFSVVYVFFMIIVPIIPNWILKLSNVFLAYPKGQKGYRCYCPTLHKFMTSTIIIFFESTPYFDKETSKSTSLEPEDDSCSF